MRITSFFIPLAYRSTGQVPLKLLQGPAVSFRYLAPEVAQRDQREGIKPEERPIVPIYPTTASGDTEAGPAADILPRVAVRSSPPYPPETPARSANATPAHWPRGLSGGRRGGVKYPGNADGPTAVGPSFSSSWGGLTELSGQALWGYVDLNHGPLPYQGSALTD